MWKSGSRVGTVEVANGVASVVKSVAEVVMRTLKAEIILEAKVFLETEMLLSTWGHGRDKFVVDLSHDQGEVESRLTYLWPRALLLCLAEVAAMAKSVVALSYGRD